MKLLYTLHCLIIVSWYFQNCLSNAHNGSIGLSRSLGSHCITHQYTGKNRMTLLLILLCFSAHLIQHFEEKVYVDIMSLFLLNKCQFSAAVAESGCQLAHCQNQIEQRCYK